MAKNPEVLRHYREIPQLAGWAKDVRDLNHPGYQGLTMTMSKVDQIHVIYELIFSISRQTRLHLLEVNIDITCQVMTSCVIGISHNQFRSAEKSVSHS